MKGNIRIKLNISSDIYSTATWNEKEQVYEIKLDLVPAPSTEKEMITTSEASKMSGISRQQILTRAKTGKIPGAKIKVTGKRTYVEIPFPEAKKLKKIKDSGPKSPRKEEEEEE